MLFYFKKRTVRVPMLKYQRSEPAQDTEPIDFIPLEGCKIRAQPGKRYAFEIESPATGRAFLIEAATQVRITSFRREFSERSAGRSGRLDEQDQATVAGQYR